MNNNLKRRDFLKTAVAVTAATTFSSSVSRGKVPADKQIKLVDAIESRGFGKTNIKLPILGYGGAALPTAWGNSLSIEDRIELVYYAYEKGIRFFDTAGNYMESQPILGEALKEVRDNVFLASKVETTNPKDVRKAVQKNLDQLKTDYLDLIQIHGTPGIEQMTVKQAMKIHAELVKLRDEGVARFIGFTAHSYFDKALELISTGGFDQCMLSYGYIPRGYDQLFSPHMVELRNTCIAKAHKQNMAIAAMKVIGAGVLGAWAGYIVPGFDKKRTSQLPAAAIRHVLTDKRVNMLVIGMRHKQEIDANIKVLDADRNYTLEDRALLAEFCSKALESDSIKKMRIE